MKSGSDIRSLATIESEKPSVFSLEMGKDGVRLFLEAALLDNTFGIHNLVLTVNHIRYPFDYTLGPRALQNYLTKVEQCDVWVSLSKLLELAPLELKQLIQGIVGYEGELVAYGRYEDVPFTLKLDIGSGDKGGEIKVVVKEPRFYGHVSLPWNIIVFRIMKLLPQELERKEGIVCVPLLRRLLRDLMIGMGFKAPLVGDAMLNNLIIRENECLFRFGRDEERVKVTPEIVFEDTQLDQMVDKILEEIRTGKIDRYETFFYVGIAVRKLWPEVIARTREASNERPDWVLPNLIAVLIAEKDLSLVGSSDLSTFLKRLARAVEPMTIDCVYASRLIARLTDKLDQVQSMEVLKEIQDVPDPEVLQTLSFAFQRIGDTAKAKEYRRRALSTARSGEVLSIVSEIVSKLARHRYEDVAIAFLEDVLADARSGLFGSVSKEVEKSSIKYLASLVKDKGKARSIILSFLEEAPFDKEGLYMLEQLSQSTREKTELVMRLKKAGEESQGKERACFFEWAGKVMVEGLGLKRRGLELLEKAFSEDPNAVGTVNMLEKIYDEFGMKREKLAFIERRISVCDGEEKISLHKMASKLAEELRDYVACANHVKEVLRIDPTDIEVLETGRRVFAQTGDAKALKEVVEALEDLKGGIGLAYVDTSKSEMSQTVVADQYKDVGEEGGFTTSKTIPEDTLARLEAETMKLMEMARDAEKALDQGDAKKAFEISSSVLKSDPNHTLAMSVAARSAKALGMMEKAADLFEKLAGNLFSTSEQFSAYLSMAETACQLDKGKEKVIQALTRCAQLAPTNPELLRFTKIFALNQRSYEEGAEIVLKVMLEVVNNVISSGDPTERKKCSSILYESAIFLWDELHQMEKAEDLLEYAVNLDPTNEPAVSDLRIISDALGDKGDITKVYE